MAAPNPNAMSFPEQLAHINEYMSKFGESQSSTMQAFMALHKAGHEDGALSSKVKELIALSIAVASRCDGCICFHTHDALQAGATSEEIHEALGVAVLMGGGPALMYATHVVEAIEQFEAQGH